MSAAAAETHASILSLPELVNNDAGWSGEAPPEQAGHAAPPMIRITAASPRTASGGPAKMISPRSIT